MPRRGTPEHAAVYKIMGKEPPGAKKGEAPAAPPAAPMSHKMEAPVVAMTASERGMKASEAREAARPAAPKEEAPAPAPAAAPYSSPYPTPKKKEDNSAEQVTEFVEDLGTVIWKRNIADRDKFKNFISEPHRTRFEISAKDVLAQASEKALAHLKGRTITQGNMTLYVNPDLSLRFVSTIRMDKEMAEQMFNSFGHSLLSPHGKGKWRVENR